MERDFYVYLNQQLIPVTKEVWEVYYRGRAKERYMHKVAKQRHISSSDNSLTEYLINCSGQSVQSAETEALRKITLLQLLDLIDDLPKEDKSLLIDLYYYDKTEKQIAHQMNLSQQTISYRKHKLLCYLRKLLL